MLSNAKGQFLFKDSLIEMESFFMVKDSSIIVRIKNISNYQLAFNGKDVKYQKISDTYFSDLSLFRIGVSLLQPSTGEFMNLRTLKSKSLFSFSIIKDIQENISNLNVFEISIRVQLIIAPSDYILKNNLINNELRKYVENRKLPVIYYNFKFKLAESNIDSCSNYLKRFSCNNLIVPLLINNSNY